MKVGWAGSSNTVNNTTGYRKLASDALVSDHPETIFSFANISDSGYATFPNLVNLGDLSACDLIIFDQSNDDAGDTPEYEAFIRKCAIAGRRVIAILNPAWTATTDDQINTPANLTAIQQARAVLTANNVATVDGLAMIQAHVTGGGHITDWFADTAHYNETGYAAIAAEIETYLPDGGAVTLGSRVNADSADYENTPVIMLGEDYDSRTGTWTDDGTAVESSDVGATITYSGTFRKFGIYRADADYQQCTVTVDGGAPIEDFALYANGYDIGTRGAHTIVVTVTGTMRIEEFWAI